MPNDDINLGDIHFEFSPRTSPLAPLISVQNRNWPGSVALILKSVGRAGDPQAVACSELGSTNSKVAREAFLKIVRERLATSRPDGSFSKQSLKIEHYRSLFRRPSITRFQWNDSPYRKGWRLADEVMRLRGCLDAEKELPQQDQWKSEHARSTIYFCGITTESMRLRRLELRIRTGEGLFGVKIPSSPD